MIYNSHSTPRGLDAQPEPLKCDVDMARVALQMAISRSMQEVAARAATTLLGSHPVVLRRLLTKIAWEVVGIGDVDGVIEATAVTARARSREKPGGDQAAILQAARKLADAPKDLGTYLAVNCTLFHPDLESVRASCARASIEERVKLAMAWKWPTLGRAVAAISVAGLMEPRGRVDEEGLMRLFEGYGVAGVPRSFLESARSAFRLCQTPAAVIAPLIWLRTRGGETRIEIDETSSPAVDGVPLAAINGDTKLGRLALRRFRAENAEVADSLVAGFSPSVATRALRLAVSIDETRRVAKRLYWPGVEHLERDAADAAFIGIGADPEEGYELGAIVLKHIDQLNEIRSELLAAQLSSQRRA